jgi:hypothetical protein
MRRARDPALFFSLYLDKHRPCASPDPRLGILEEVDKFIEKYDLQFDVAPHGHREVARIDLDAVHGTSAGYHLLFRAQTERSKSNIGRYFQCLGYVYADALIIQFAISRFSDWVGNLMAGWRELSDELRAGFNGFILDTAHEMTFGSSVVYWTIADGHDHPEEYRDEIGVLFENQRLFRTSTDLGPLWRCERPLFPTTNTVSQDLWILITARSAELEVNKRYYRPSVSDAPDFAVLALAGHKLAFESLQYHAMGKELEPLSRQLEEGAAKTLELQAGLGNVLDELREHKAVEFQRKLVEGGHQLALYKHEIGRINALRRTLMVNSRNYLINCIALISSVAVVQVIQSRNQEQAAANFLDALKEEEIFRTYLGQLQGKWNQIDTDLEYAEVTSENYTASLRSVTDQLWIAGQREVAEIAHHISVDSAAVVASVAAILILELVVKKYEPGAHHGAEVADHPLLGNLSLLALWVVMGSFALTQALSSSWRGKLLERCSFTLASGALGAWLSSFLCEMKGQLSYVKGILELICCTGHSWIFTMVGAVLGLGFGRFLYGYVQRELPRLGHAEHKAESAHF